MKDEKQGEYSITYILGAIAFAVSIICLFALSGLNAAVYSIVAMLAAIAFFCADIAVNVRKHG